MRIVISGIPIDVQKKNIKNMHLQVKPPDGHVVISAPLSVDDKAIEAYARTQLGFIKKSIGKFQDQPRASKRQYVSGETIYIWGKQYFLVFKPDNQKNSFEMPPFFIFSPEYEPYSIFNETGFAEEWEQLQDLKTALVRQIIIATAKNCRRRTATHRPPCADLPKARSARRSSSRPASTRGFTAMRPSSTTSSPTGAAS